MAKPNPSNYIPFAIYFYKGNEFEDDNAVLFAQSLYYPESFIKDVTVTKITNAALKQSIHNLLVTNHQRNSNGARDTLGCPKLSTNCYNQMPLGYDGARKVLFGKLHLEQEGNKYFIKDVYCHKEFDGADIRPGAIPNGSTINCEHTWPQSKFTSSYPKETQKSDLHHLFPTDSKANTVRGNYDFAEVSDSTNRGIDKTCTASKSGSSVSGGGSNLFEPPAEHKGNVARALFYFSVRYEMPIPASEEAFLRAWNEADPVDDAEMERNNQIQLAQGNRNPFIDFPELANMIDKF